VFGSIGFVLPAPAKPEPGAGQCDRINKAAADLKDRGEWSAYWMPTTDVTNKEDQSISVQMSESWASFAKTGNPNPAGRAMWPAYNLKDDVMREFTQGNRPTIKDLEADRVNYQIQAVKTLYGVR
jgi:para-nitrobenzyl esterase